MFRKFIGYVLILGLMTLLTACGGGGGGRNIDSGNNTGYFVDSAVSGLSYVTSSGITGVTDANGAFEYAPGDTVTFSIGNVEIGQATGASLLTPVSLVPGATDETDTTVSNIARFLQSLDTDGDPDNGIAIDPAVVTAAAGQVLNFSSASFDTEATALVEALRVAAFGAGDTGTLVDTVTAQAHLLGSLLCEYSGTFAGTFVHTAGPEVGNNGTWTFSIDSDGNLTGTANTSDGLVGLSGSVSSDGTSVAGNVTDGASFTGTIGLDGSVDGTWENTLYGTSGTYTGSRTATTSTSCGGGGGGPGGGSPGGGGSSGGGSGGPGSGSSGSITITGDAGLAGAFSPVVLEGNFSSALSGYVLWSTTPDFASTRVGTVISVSLVPSTGEITSVYAGDSTNPLGIYYYALSCLSADCSAATVDLTAKTVTFNNFTLPVGTTTATNMATSPITLNGTLTYSGN